MRTLITVIGVLAATPVAAQPSATADCHVIIARAPDDVRAAIDQWVERETSCGVTVDVRAVPTEGGYYLIARDEDGRVHERIVPDAASAGVLVASWVANWEPVPPPEPESESAPESELGLGPVPEPEPVAAPEPPHHRAHWVALDAMAGAADGGSLAGIRGEVDLLVGKHWRLGVAGMIGEGQIVMNAAGWNGNFQGPMSTDDQAALLYLTREIRLGPWRVRPAFGLGEMFTTAHLVDNNGPVYFMTQDVGFDSTFAEVSLRIAHDLGAEWGLEGGVIVDLMTQNWNTEPHFDPTQLTPSTYSEMLHRGNSVGFAIGVRHRL